MTGKPAGAPDLRTLISDYLAMRRALGFKLEGTGRLLFAFADHLDRCGAQTITVKHALRFATASAAASARSQALRLSAIRLFTRWAQLLDPTIEVPSPRLLPARASRPAPFLYSDAARRAARRCRRTSSAVPVTFRTLLSLQAATGIRTGEATGLDISDLDLQQEALTVTGKYGKIRLLPLHSTVTEALTGYLDMRSQLLPAAHCPALLITTRGTRLSRGSIHPTFRALVERAGLTAASSSSRPRPHDLRHTFAVNTMLDAYRSGGDPAVTLPLLTTWLGHAEPRDTYWYLTGTAELMAAATARLNHAAGPDSGSRT